MSQITQATDAFTSNTNSMKSSFKLKHALLMGLGLLWFASGTAQHNFELNNQGALLRVQAGADVFVQGDVHMEGSTALFNHDGFLEVQGNMYSDNLFQQRGTGTVRMENNDVNTGERQFIEGSYAVRGGQTQIGNNDGSFYNLELANTQGMVHLVGNGNVADVRNAVDFLPAAATGSPPRNRIVTHDTAALPANGSAYNAVFGMMNPNPSLATFLNNSVGAGGNSSNVDAGYVQGNLRRAIAPGGGSYGYLVGLEPAGAGAARGFQYILLDFTSSTYDVVNSYYEQGSPNVIGGAPAECGYAINYFAGADHGEWMFSAENAAGTGDYEVVIWPQDGTWPAQSVWFVTKDNAIQGTLGDCGPTPTGLDRTAFSGFLSPSEFDFAGSSVVLDANELLLSALPVDNRYINVRWQNLEERMLSSYVLERSSDNQFFGKIAERNPQGNDNQAWTYEHPDYDVLADVDYFYRVRYSDQNGNEYLSNTVQARLGANGLASEIHLYPVPVGGEGMTLQITAPEEKAYEATVYDPIGRLVWRESILAPPGLSERQIGTGEWAVGTYFMHLRSGNESLVKEIVRIQ